MKGEKTRFGELIIGGRVIVRCEKTGLEVNLESSFGEFRLPTSSLTFSLSCSGLKTAYQPIKGVSCS